MRRENLLEDVWLRGGGKSDGGVQAHQKLISPNLREKGIENEDKEQGYFGQKCPHLV